MNPEIRLGREILYDTLWAPFIPMSPENRIEGYSQRVRGSVRLWRARVGLVSHLFLENWGIDRLISTGDIGSALWLLIPNTIAIAGFATFLINKNYQRLLFGSKYERQYLKKLFLGAGNRS